MLGILETPFGFLDMYSFCINAGIFVTLVMQVVLIYKVLREWKYLLFSVCYFILLFLGQYASAFVRCVNDGALDGKMNLWRGVTEQIGTHFLGHVIVYSIILLPLMWMVISIFAEPDHTTLLKGANILFISLPVQHIFNRLGCLCRGCCYGKQYEGILAISLPFNEDIPYPKTFPSQLLEIVCMVILIITVSYLYCKRKDIIGPVIIGFAVTFFLSEFFMCNPYAVKHFGMTYVQRFSMLEMVVGIVYCVMVGKKGFSVYSIGK